ncbi:MAG: hydrogenase maturation protease [Deltaproteobacteria bacterium]|nr:hydrogenase maturation protease [Deltaproteobacteria bacterium]
MKYIVGSGTWAMGDDGIGLRVIEHLDSKYPKRDFGLVDLSSSAFNLLTYFEEDTEMVLVVDCIVNQKNPGDTVIFDLDEVESVKDMSNFTTHEDDVIKIIHMAKEMGYKIPHIKFLAITPESIEESMELSDILREKLDEYAEMAVELIRNFN